jgi:hypothetical protein
MDLSHWDHLQYLLDQKAKAPLADPNQKKPPGTSTH